MSRLRCPVCSQILPLGVGVSMLDRFNVDRTGVCPNCGAMLRLYTGSLRLFGLMLGLGAGIALLGYYAFEASGEYIYLAIGLFSFVAALIICAADSMAHTRLCVVGSRNQE